MVNIAPFLTTAVILSSFNWVMALPHPGSDMSKRDSYSSSSSGMNAPADMGYSSNSDYGSSNSGYGSPNSGYGSSNSGYDSSSGNQDGYGVTTTTTMMSSSTMATASTSISVTTTTTMNDTSTMMSSSTMTTASTSTASVMYGSGSMNSGSGSYNDCVAQCMASFPPLPTATSTYGSSQTYGSSSGDSSSVGTGATKTIIVAPTQGVLRFMPFATNASVGDTILFMWGANNHTVTKGSALEPCNATQDALFTTSQENKGFTFTQEVNSTDPIFFHCATPGHCPKGMFGIINPPMLPNAPTSVSGMMQSLIAQSPSLSDYAAATDNATSGSQAALWGGAFDMASIPAWAHSLMVENVLFTRRTLALNPEIYKEDGSIDLSSTQSMPLMYPPDVQEDLVQNSGVSTSSSDSPSQASPSQASPTSAAGAASTNNPVTSPTNPSNGASSTGPKALAVLVAGLATVLIL